MTPVTKTFKSYLSVTGSYISVFNPTQRGLPILVHLFVVLLVLAGCHSLHPLLILQIPVDGLHNANLKSGFRLPAEVRFDLGRVNAIAPVMTKAILHMLD